MPVYGEQVGDPGIEIGESDLPAVASGRKPTT